MYVLQSSEALCSDGASYPDYVELTAKHHAVEAIEVLEPFTVSVENSIAVDMTLLYWLPRKRI